MLGAIIGDIVGSRFEFNNHRSTEFELFHKDCSFTDDTICTIAVADWLNGSMIVNTKLSLSHLMKYWCRKYPHPMGGYGASFNQWIFGQLHEPYYSFGNGSAMRVSPVAWTNEGIQGMMEIAKNSASVTHSHPEGMKGAECIAYAIWHLKFGGGCGNGKKWVKSMAETNYGYYLGLTCDQIRKMNSFDETCMVTVPQAIQCFSESHDFESAIRLAVSIGGDSDTIAAITGSLAEAAYGIPVWIVEKAMTYLPEDMKEVINQFKTKFNYANELRRL